MIEFTIKTLDSNVHQFSVQDEITVAELKEQIRERLGIETNCQRLIFCGKVLTDDSKLADINVGGKVLHLVQRPPPSPGSRHQNNDRPELFDPFIEDQRIMPIPNINDLPILVPRPEIPLNQALAIDPPSELGRQQQQALTMTPTANRLEFIRQTIDYIHRLICSLCVHMRRALGTYVPNTPAQGSTEASARPAAAEPMDVDTTPQTGESASAEAPPQQERRGELGALLREFQRRYGDISPPPARHSLGELRESRPRDLALLLNELDGLQQDFAPYRNYYVAILTDTSRQQLSQQDRNARQQIIEHVSDIMHSFAHAYHAASDIQVTIGEHFPRLSSVAISPRTAIPLQAHINVVQTTRRPENANRPPPRLVTPVGAPGNLRVHNERPRQHLGETDTPEPITYQVEIETRLPIALPLDPTLINGLTAIANMQQQEAEQEQGQRAQTGHAQQLLRQAQAQAQAQTQEQAQTEAQAQRQQAQRIIAQHNQAHAQEGRPGVLSDIENLLRSLGQAHPGMEVVMSMEHVHSSHPLLNPTSVPAESETASFSFSPAFGATSIGQALGATLMGALHPNAGQTGRARTAGAQPGATGALRRTTAASGSNATVSNAAGTSSGTAAASAATATATATGAGGNPATSDASRGAGRDVTNRGRGVCRGRGVARTPGIPFTQLAYGTFGGPFQNVRTTVVGADGTSTVTRGGVGGIGISTLGPTSLTIQPDGGVILTPMSAENTGVAGDVFNNVFNHVFRNHPPSTTAAATQPSSTGGSTNTTSANTGTANVASTVTVNSGNTPRTSVPNPSSDSAARRSAAMSAAGGTATSTAAASTANGARRTNGAVWGFGNNSENTHQERLGPLSMIARARSLQQQVENRRRQHEATHHPHVAPVHEHVPGEHARRPPRSATAINNTRAHHLAMACMSYDPFLKCDSQHARRRLSDRRTTTQRRHVALLRQRDRRQTAPAIDSLRERNVQFTARHMAVMLRLLNGPFCLEGQLNAFMVAVARHLYLEPENRPPDVPPYAMPREFPFIRLQMRQYVQGVLLNIYRTNPAANTTVHAAQEIIMQVSPFLANIGMISPLDPGSRPLDTVHTFLNRRLPTLIACIMSDGASDLFVARFYATFARFFTDLCATVMQICVRGFEGMRTIYTSFVHSLTDCYDAHSADWLRLLADENLMMIRSTIDSQSPINFYSNYRYDGSRTRSRPTNPQSTPHTTPLMSQSPRNDTPDTMESLPSISIPTMSSASSETSGSPAPTDDQRSFEDSPPLEEEDNEASSGADTVSTTSHNSRLRSPFETRSAGTSPKHDTPDSGRKDASSEDSQRSQLPRVLTPSGDRVAPTEKKPSPGEEKPSPAEEKPSPAEEKTSPAEGKTSPADEKTSPIEAQALPAEERPSPAEEGASPAEDRSPTSSSRSSPDSLRLVPPVMILDHWGEEWVPVFTRDQRAQRELVQEPLSDMYLSGMPSRKRRCVRAARPQTTLDGFMNESVREATDRAASIDTAQLRNVIRDQVRSLVRTRSQESEDYDPVRYPSAARFLDQAKQNEKRDRDGK